MFGVSNHFSFCVDWGYKHFMNVWSDGPFSPRFLNLRHSVSRIYCIWCYRWWSLKGLHLSLNSRELNFKFYSLYLLVYWFTIYCYNKIFKNILFIFQNSMKINMWTNNKMKLNILMTRYKIIMNNKSHLIQYYLF